MTGCIMVGSSIPFLVNVDYSVVKLSSVIDAVAKLLVGTTATDQMPKHLFKQQFLDLKRLVGECCPIMVTFALPKVLKEDVLAAGLPLVGQTTCATSSAGVRPRERNVPLGQCNHSQDSATSLVFDRKQSLHQGNGLPSSRSEGMDSSYPFSARHTQRDCCSSRYPQAKAS